MTPPEGEPQPSPQEPPAPVEAPAPPAESTPRRDFLKTAACAALGGCAIAAPIGAAVVVLANPLRSRGVPLPVRITTLSALPLTEPHAPPKFFQVVTERRDAWTKFPARAIGAVFLQRTGENEVVAFNAACPHLGCAVEYRAGRAAFYCPCHNSEFAVTGEVHGKSPSRRGLDTLPVELREEGEVWVYFENFKAGIAQKVSLA
ncbi:MAG TPA: Rieske 2Fe-2S domain-containing protein [Chthoniobacter sp.]|jgi:Rieske Fe-S protein